MTKTVERPIKKFSPTQYRYEVEIVSLPCILFPEDSITVLPKILERDFDLCMKSFDPDNRVVVALEWQSLDPGIYLSMRRFSDFNVEAMHDAKNCFVKLPEQTLCRWEFLNPRHLNRLAKKRFQNT